MFLFNDFIDTRRAHRLADKARQLDDADAFLEGRSKVQGHRCLHTGFYTHRDPRNIHVFAAIHLGSHGQS